MKFICLCGMNLFGRVLVMPARTLFDLPYVGLVFRNEMGLNIFSKWKKENDQDKIAIGVITGINNKYPYWYRVIVGENLNKNLSNSSILGIKSKLHTMEAKDEFNIGLLKEIIAKNNKFVFIPVLLEDVKSKNFRIELGFVKETTSIILKDVAEIKENDLFLHQGILPFDNPVNPTKKERFIEAFIRERQKKF